MSVKWHENTRTIGEYTLWFREVGDTYKGELFYKDSDQKVRSWKLETLNTTQEDLDANKLKKAVMVVNKYLAEANPSSEKVATPMRSRQTKAASSSSKSNSSEEPTEKTKKIVKEHLPKDSPSSSIETTPSKASPRKKLMTSSESDSKASESIEEEKTIHQSEAAPNNPETCSGKHRVRLLIGEGNFSFAEALINKHDTKHNHGPDTSLARSIIATELKDTISCEECITAQLFEEMANLTVNESVKDNRTEIQCEKCRSTSERIETLRVKGVDVRLGFNGLKISEQIPLQRFKRIHWNVPHDGGNIKNDTLSKIIIQFFGSCSKVQQISDRVYMAVPYPSDYTRDFYQGYIYDLTIAATENGYQLIKKREFGLSRYPEYTHVRTNKNEKADIMNKGAKEFVFQKVDQEKHRMLRQELVKKKESYKTFARELAKTSPKTYSVESKTFWETNEEMKKHRSFYVCSSDEDSSEYESE